MIQYGGKAMWNIKNWRLLEIIQILSSKSLPQMCYCVDPIFRSVSSSYTKNKRNKNDWYTKCDGKNSNTFKQHCMTNDSNLHGLRSLYEFYGIFLQLPTTKEIFEWKKKSNKNHLFSTTFYTFNVMQFFIKHMKNRALWWHLTQCLLGKGFKRKKNNATRV